MLKVKNVHKSFGENEILKGVDLTVEKGDVVVIIGPSGSGKSTLLRCATLLETMDKGSLKINGQVAACEVNGRSEYVSKLELTKIKNSFGLVFQQFNLFPHFSVLKNVCDAPVVVEKRDKAEVEKEARELIEKVGLKGKEDSYPCQLSGGQQQRVAIARALALHPQILFFDEPTSALDPELTGEILKVIRQLASEHMTMVIVTHEMAFARDVADRVIFMDGGYIIEQGDPKEVIEHPKEERTKQFLARFAQN